MIDCLFIATRRSWDLMTEDFPMHVHHVNCGCQCPIGGAFYDGFSKRPKAQLVGHCLIIESDRGLVLVDTGFGERDIARPERLSKFFRVANNVQLKPELTMRRHVEALGFTVADVQHIIVTHLDFDHAGGLSDFPQATVHVMEAEYQAAERRKGFLARNRYSRPQLEEVKRWKFYGDREGGANWCGFTAVRDMDDLPPELLIVPLPGHTTGHAGVAIQTGHEWLLHAGDAYFYRGEMGSLERHCTPGLRLLQTLTETHRRQRLENQARLRELSVSEKGNVRIFCSHDAKELEACQAAERLPIEMKRAA